MKIWVATEYVLTGEDCFGEENNIHYYSSIQQAIDAVYRYLAYDFTSEDIANRVRIDKRADEVSITTECGDDYGLYDCRYEIIPRVLDEDFGA